MRLGKARNCRRFEVDLPEPTPVLIPVIGFVAGVQTGCASARTELKLEFEEPYQSWVLGRKKQHPHIAAGTVVESA